MEILNKQKKKVRDIKIGNPSQMYCLTTDEY
jgi:hypothetical protein